ncbi:MAG: 50S ribosomal protein L9 [Actinobacteria bacterium]|nr:50S ribosomal protein L9 [Actinomycetota bacterium]MCB9411570.1 50S ribosomal protein L9 [Actinomycetota bacterium]
MKLILLQDVTGLGESGDVVEVKDGYGRNYLVPRGLAIGWTKGGEKQIAQIRRARAAKEIRGIDHAKEVQAALEGLSITVAARAHDGGQLFGSVTEADVAAAIRAAGGPAIEKRSIQLPGHVKHTGDVKATVALHPEVSAAITVSVVAA